METSSTFQDLVVVIFMILITLADTYIIAQIIGALVFSIYFIVKTFYLIKNKGKSNSA